MNTPVLLTSSRKFLAPGLVLLLLGYALLACQSTAPMPDPTPQAPLAKQGTENKESIAPEAASGFREKMEAVKATSSMVGAANPHASRAGQAVLREGGSAVDATICMSLVLTLVEPQSSGIGGGAFLVMRDKNGVMETWDGRETAPAAATPDMFLDKAGKPIGFFDAVVGGLAVGTPGLLRMLELAHKKHGKLPWKRLLEPAIKLAEEGFAISPRLHLSLSRDPALAKQEVAREYFYQEDGTPKPIGTILKNPELAQTLRAIAENGADAFYKGPIAQDIVQTVQNAKRPGRLTLEDMQNYKAKLRPAVCAP